MKVLVVDDDPTSRLIIGVALHTLGHQYGVVADGAQAWDDYQSWHPDTVISDLLMPTMSGLELCRAIRAHPGGENTYVIMITSLGAIDDVHAGMTAGADDYLVKPIDTDDLEGRLIGADRITTLHRRMTKHSDALEVVNHDLADLARRDPLTALGNRRALEEDLELLEARVSRYGHRYCMALLDVDHFKSYNDSHGHQAGDAVLQRVATQLIAQARGGDSIYRYGGDEFLCIFPEQSMTNGAQAVQRMRRGLERLAISRSGDPLSVITFSAGLAMLDPAQPRPVADVLTDADRALYRAKQFGRNRVEGSSHQRA
jgi:diguanylate cyclase (GGDEF)-like protein